MPPEMGATFRRGKTLALCPVAWAVMNPGTSARPRQPTCRPRRHAPNDQIRGDPASEMWKVAEVESGPELSDAPLAAVRRT